MIRTSWSAW